MESNQRGKGDYQNSGTTANSKTEMKRYICDWGDCNEDAISTYTDYGIMGSVWHFCHKHGKMWWSWYPGGGR
jgi:hypothetical protein